MKELSELVEEIKDNGLENTINRCIEIGDTSIAKWLVSLVFEYALDDLEDEKYEEFVLNVCDEILR